ncbi:hypothetical protein EI555_005799, partial [Monodon monoceros]
FKENGEIYTNFSGKKKSGQGLYSKDATSQVLAQKLLVHIQQVLAPLKLLQPKDSKFRKALDAEDFYMELILDEFRDISIYCKRKQHLKVEGKVAHDYLTVLIVFAQGSVLLFQGMTKPPSWRSMLYIVNFQWTLKDDWAALKLHG